jgi:hypothetical protein
MNRKKGAVMDRADAKLLASPHILGKLIQLVSGKWQADPFQREQLAVHLAECSSCRTGLILLLCGEQKYEERQNTPESLISTLLAQILTVHHEIEAQGYEYMGAYAETIVAEGREKADKSFPILAEHVKKCSACHSRLEETLTFLKEFKEGG